MNSFSSFREQLILSWWLVLRSSRMGWGLLVVSGFLCSSLCASCCSCTSSEQLYLPPPFKTEGEKWVDSVDDGGIGKKHENCCSHYTLGFHAHKWLIFSLDYCSKCSSFVSKTKTTFLLLFIFGKWCIMGFWTRGLVKSTDISFLSSYSGPFLFALYGKGLERFLLFPSPPLFSVQSVFFLIFRHFIASLLLKLWVSFFLFFSHRTKEYF